MLAMLLACVEPGPMPMNDLGGEFWDAPFPSELRRTPEGGLDLTGFPERENQPLVEQYAAIMETELDGAGTTSPISFRFEGPLDLELLPSPMGTIYPSSALFLIDIDPDSPEFGRRIPVEWDFQEDETTFQSSNLLTLAPLPGIPLRPSTTYAAGVTTKVAAQHPDFAEVFSSADPDFEQHELLGAALFEQGVGTDEVAIATVFTTQDPVDELAVIATWIQDELGHAALDQDLQLVYAATAFTRYEGTVSVPVWQHGSRPYASEGGAFVVQDGEPEIYVWERVRFSLTVPTTEMPSDGWPVVLYAHGTYGDWTSCCYDYSKTSAAGRAAEAGLAMFGISQPLHGDRMTASTNQQLHNFNYFNPDAARSVFRQGALDSVYLAHVLANSQHVFDGVIRTDPDRTLYMGHSQGGITGAIALPFLGNDIQGAVLSGAGGGLSLAMVHREEGGIDIEELITDALGFAGDEELDALHPVAGLVQSFAEVTDSANYAPYWFSRRAWFTGPPVPVLMFEGLQDIHTPPITTEALAAAAGVPVIEPAVSVNDANNVTGIGTVEAPFYQNVSTRMDQTTTAGLAQYEDQDHFAIYDLGAAQKLYRNFLKACAEGNPRIGETR
ncbi:MAG: hypothetical protein GY913_18175 [Proteobacteria bacterium]|nr:hypothetical protein [Pseudomonadota bacterium]MCP4918836.1 hypothetical protein [Pseudomonadota bacterium]